MMKVFGKVPSGERLKRIEAASNYKNGSFQNIEPTDVMREGASYFKLMKDFFNKPKTTRPASAIPVIKTELQKNEISEPELIWFGHSSYMIRAKELNILVDPVFSRYASPVGIFGKQFDYSETYTAEDFPELDIVIITHDHYDHLDYKTVLKLKCKVKRWVVALGVGAHLEYWGIDTAKITEINWGGESLFL